MHRAIGLTVNRYTDWLGRYRVILWLLLALLLASLAVGLPKLQLSVDADKFFLQHDENALAKQKFKEKYQIGENVGIYVSSGDAGETLLDAGVLDRLSLLSRELEQLPFVRAVQSLSRLWSQSRGEADAERLASFAEYTDKFPELAALHSRDWQHLWLLLELYPYEEYQARLEQRPDSEPLLDQDKLQDLYSDLAQKQEGSPAEQQFVIHLPSVLAQLDLQTVGQLKQALQQQPQPGNILAKVLDALLQRYQQPEPAQLQVGNWNFIPVGIPVNSYRLEREMTADLTRVLSIAALICLICILLLLQSYLGALAALLCVLANVLVVFGLSGWLGLAVDKTFVMIPVLLGFASSISYCVHIERSFERYWQQYNPTITARRASRNLALRKALRQNIQPLSFAALTTVLSLLSFIAIPIPMIRAAGFQSALAVALSYFFALTLFSSLLLLRRIKANTGRRIKLVARFNSRLQKAPHNAVIQIALLCYRHRRLSLTIAASLLLTSALLLPRLQVDLSTESVLGTRFRYVQQLMRVSRSEIGAGGFYNIDLLFDDEPLQKKHLLQLAEFERRLAQNGLVKNVTSLTTFIQSVQRVYRGSAEFPDSERQTRQALLTWERLFQGQLSQWYAEQQRSLRVLVQVRQGSSQENIAHMQEVRRLALEVFPRDSGVRVKPLGGVFQLAIMNQYIVNGLLRSFSLSILFVAIALFILLRSVRIGLIAMIPNLFPALLTASAVVLLGRPLEFVSMTVGPMIIGLAVDDTIYFLGHVKHQLISGQRKAGGYSYTELDRVVKRSLYQVAPALITTALILCALFASLLLSHAANIRYMGLYTIIAMLAALFSDLFLTPILLRWAYGRKA